MEITDIRVRRTIGDSKLKAYITVTFDKSFVVHNIKVIEGKSGLFIAMPSRRTRNEVHKDIAHPILSDFRAYMQSAILRAFEAAPITAEKAQKLEPSNNNAQDHHES